MALAACIQMCSEDDVDVNLAKAQKWLSVAAKAGAKLVVLPEMFATMGLSERDRTQYEALYNSEVLPQFLSQQALELGIWIVGGTIPMLSEHEHKAYAASLVLNAQGEIVARYDKIHLFDAIVSDTETHQESALIQAGENITVVDTPCGKLGLAVCYDVRFPELFRCLFNQGAEIVALPAAFTVPTGQAHWEVLTRARAIENFCYLLGAGQEGTHPGGRRTYGHSVIINPWGTVQQCLEAGEGVVIADIDLTLLRQIRHKIPVGSHQKIPFQPR